MQRLFVKEDFFKKWSPEMAFVLGIIFSDGFLGKNKNGTHFISIYHKYRRLLVTIQQLLDYHSKIQHYPKRKYNTNFTQGEIFFLRIQDQEAISDIMNLGFVKYKNKVLKFPKVPNEFIKDFIRGCWTGKGSVFISKKQNILIMSFQFGSLSFISRIEKELYLAGLKKRKIYKQQNKNPSYRIKYNTIKDAMIFYEKFFWKAPLELSYLKHINLIKSYFTPVDSLV